MFNFSPTIVPPTLFFFFFFFFFLFTSAAVAGTTRRAGRILHQPFFPVESDVPPAASPSQSPQKSQPKQPVSTTPSTPQSTFFPTITVPSPPPPPPAAPPPPKYVVTFPANISAIHFPHPPSASPSRSHIIVLAVSVSFLSVALLLILATFALFYRRRSFVAVDKASRTDSVRLYPPNTATSDGGAVKSRSSSNSSSSDFLYLGTLPNPPVSNDETATRSSNASTKISIPGLPSPTAYQRLDSPELNPLPPLPRHNLKQNNCNSEATLDTDEDDDDDDEEEFFSPRGSSSGPKDSPDRHDQLGGVARNFSSSRRDYPGLFGADRYGSRSFNSRTASYPFSNSCSSRNTASNTQSPSPPCNSSPKSIKSSSPDVMTKFPAPSRPAPPPPLQNTPTILSKSSSSSSSTVSFANRRIESQLLPRKLPPPPPPVPAPRFWENHEHDSSATSPILAGPSSSDPGELQTSTAEQVQSNDVSQETSEDTTPRPRLKPLHWDKVRASSDRATVWDQLKSSYFQLNEEMIETLFMVNGSNIGRKDNVRRPIMPLLNPENRVLDPKKSQNIAILLRALNVTVEEACEALSEGNADSLGSELLESLLKMAPTKDEERKLRDFKDESPFKLGPAEKFLKAVLDVPFAFKRVDAMLYIVNFDSEIEYLQRSFGTLEAASKELRSSKMFFKLLEAVLKTGNRMNVGTNRGDAHAFKLDTLLKLVDVKGKDGKTTLLHFVVQEIVRSEGSEISGNNNNEPIPKQNAQTSLQHDLEFRKLGLQLVSSLSRELASVKKAATMDACVLSNEVGKLTEGIIKVKDVAKLSNETGKDGKFLESMNLFLNKAEEEIVKIEEQKRCAFGVVKEVTEYFHGDSGKEEAHPLRIFTVVRDFLAVLDRVCREVGKVQERSIYGCGSARQFSVPANPILVPVITMLDVKGQYSSSSGDEGSSSSA